MSIHCLKMLYRDIHRPSYSLCIRQCHKTKATQSYLDLAIISCRLQLMYLFCNTVVHPCNNGYCKFVTSLWDLSVEGLFYISCPCRKKKTRISCELANQSDSFTRRSRLIWWLKACLMMRSQKMVSTLRRVKAIIFFSRVVSHVWIGRSVCMLPLTLISNRDFPCFLEITLSRDWGHIIEMAYKINDG